MGQFARSRPDQVERAADAAAYGLVPGQPLAQVIAAVRPRTLIGATGVYGSFEEEAIREMARHTEVPVIMPLSNPTSRVEAHPADVMEWTAGRALIATGSPFPGVPTPGGQMRVIGQANNVYVFPGVGLGAIAAEATMITDDMFLGAADVIAAAVTPERFAEGGLYPPVTELRTLSRQIAIAVADEARRAGVSGLPDGVSSSSAVDAAIWEPNYVDYVEDVDDVDGSSEPAAVRR